MKKKIISIVALGLCAAFCIPVAACNKSKSHVHTFSEEWEHNESYHWHEATCEHTDEVSDKAQHVAGDWQFVSESTTTVHGRREKACKDCGYVMEIEQLPLKEPNPITALGLHAWSFTGADLGVEGIEQEDGSYKITAANPDGEAWHIKLDGNLNLDSGSKYKLTFVAQSTVSGNIKALACGSEKLQWLEANEEKTFDITFNVGDSKYICVELGEPTEAFEIIFKSVTLEKLGEDTNPITRLGFSATAFDGSLGVVGTPLDNGQYKIEVAHPDDEAWHVKLDGNFSLTAGKKYKLSATLVKTVVTENVAVEVSGLGDPTLYWVEAGEEKTIEHVFTATGDHYICLQLGKGTEAFEVLFKSVTLEEVVETSNPIVAMGFTAHGETEALGVSGAEQEDGSYKITVAHPDDTDWHVKLDGNLDITSGKQYKLSFTLTKSVVTENVWIEVGGVKSDPFWLEAGVEKTIDFTFTATDNKYVCIQLGKGSEAFEVLIKSANLEEVVEDTNPITSLGFNAKGETADLGVSGAAQEDGSYKITVAHPDGTDWHVKLEGNFTLTEGKQYEVSFTLTKTVVTENVFIEVSGMGGAKPFWLEKDVEKKITLVFTATGDHYICLQLGKGEQPFEVTVKSATVAEHAEHSYATDWSTGDEKHWHECVCGLKKDEAAHTYDNACDADCNVCGATRTPAEHVWTADDCTSATTCSVCGKTGGDPLGHKWTEATCTAAKTCSVCHVTEGDPLGHTGGTATCTAKAVCTRCNNEYGDLAAHSYGTAWKNNTEKHWHECTACGAKKDEAAHTPDREASTEEHAKVCSVCDYVIEAALSHTCGSGVKQGGQAATCTADGWKDYYKCGGCEKLYTEATCENIITDLATWKTGAGKINKLGHTGGTATCTEKAECTRCHEKYGDLAAHTWVAADCTTPKTCSVCNTTEGDPLGHTGGTATCTEKAVCTRCGNKYGELAEHDYKTEWTSDGSKHWHECNNCDAESEKVDHTFGEWEADAEKDGYAKSVCSVCEYKVNRALVAEENNPIVAMGFTAKGETAELGVSGEETIVGGYKITVDNPDGTDWHVKFESKYDFEADKEYKITVTLKKTVVTENIWIEASGKKSDPFWCEAGKEETIEFTFTATDGENREYICLLLGKGEEAFAVTIESLGIERLSPATPCAITAMGFTAKGENAELGVTSEETENGYYKIKVANPNGTDWHVKLEGNYDFEDGKEYKITVTLKKTVITENIWIEASGKKSDAFWCDAGKEKTVEYTFTATSSKYVCMLLGKGEKAFEVIIKSLSIERLSPATTCSVTELGFAAKGDNEGLGVSGTALVNGNYKITVTNPDKVDWHVKLEGTLTTLTAGNKYKITITLTKTKFSENIKIEAGGGDSGLIWLNADEEKTVEYEFTARESEYICVLLGAIKGEDTAAEFDVIIKQLKIEAVTE